jgi:hypothetical protein
VKHVAGESLHDADMLSRSAMPAEKEIGEDEEWQRFQINAVTNLRPQPSTYNVFTIDFGIGCDVMATSDTPFTVVGGRGL